MQTCLERDWYPYCLRSPYPVLGVRFVSCLKIDLPIVSSQIFLYTDIGTLNHVFGAARTFHHCTHLSLAYHRLGTFIYSGIQQPPGNIT